MASSSLIPSSSLSQNWEYDVFVSFHGEDVRRYVLSHILKEFKNKGINPFIDNEIKRGESIGPELKKAIRGSRIAIALLSKRYASSSWCLNELVEIMKCSKELGQTVITIFYEVDPTDVKKQTGGFGDVFKKTCGGKKKVVIDKWVLALAEVATIAGFHSRNWVDDAAMIEDITADILKKLFNFTPSSDFNRFIGMEAHLIRMEPLLRLDLEEGVRMIGIWGPSGIGKTTIARFLYDQLSSRGRYQLSAFVENIKELPCSDYMGALVYLRQQFISQITNQSDFKISHLDRLKYVKALVVLDNVTESVQLEAMAENNQCFGSGTRVIITTQDRSLLRKYKIPIYKMNYPTIEESFQIFCMYAFKQKFPDDGFEELSREVTSLAGDLPLGLQVIGSYFYGMSKEEWVKKLPRVRTQLNGRIQSKLKFSYDALLDEDKDLFLHIACLFNNRDKERVEGYLAKSIRNVSLGLQELVDKSLISISDYGTIKMHDLLAQLGEEIVRTRKRPFLVETGDICNVLTDDKTIAGSVIGLKSPSCPWDGEDGPWDVDYDIVNISGTALEGMSNLQFLRLSSTSMRGCLNNISQKLRLIEWEYCSLTRFPFTDLECLVELNMHRSRLEKLWEGNKPLPNLKWMNLSLSENLKEIPDLSTATSLRKLNLRFCRSLVELPSSIGNATNLEELNLEACVSLMELPSSIGNATSLRILNLSLCCSLKELPSSISNATNLEELNLGRCKSLKKFPSFTRNATNLRKLNLAVCARLMELPSSIGNATNLEELNLGGCNSLKKLPSSLGNATNLEELNLQACVSLVELPSSIGNATNLEELNLQACVSLVELPSSIGNATSLRILNLSLCCSLKELPSSISNATNLEELNLRGCRSLKKFPSFTRNATNLRKLNLAVCTRLKELPFSIGNATNLEELNLSYCSSLKKLPSTIGNLHKLSDLDFEGCSKLEALPTNIKLESLTKLNLSHWPKFINFHGISPNIEDLYLGGSAINLKEFLKKLPHAFNSIIELDLSSTKLQELGPWIKGFSRLGRLKLSGMLKLVSISHLPDSLLFLDAENCMSLEILDCSFCNPEISLNFRDCFKLNQAARDLIIRTSTRGLVVLPGVEVPDYFTNRFSQSSVTLKLNQKPLRTSTDLRACILVGNGGRSGSAIVNCSITSKENVCTTIVQNLELLSSDQLYIFQFGVKTSTELDFNFRLDQFRSADGWKILECGVLQLLDE